MKKVLQKNGQMKRKAKVNRQRGNQRGSVGVVHEWKIKRLSHIRSNGPK
jgi:hypothetical protein